MSISYRYDTTVKDYEAVLIDWMCQFLIGMIRHLEQVYAREFDDCVCQFLIGMIRLYSSGKRARGGYEVSIPYRYDTTSVCRKTLRRTSSCVNSL